MFGVVFPDHTFPLDATAFAQRTRRRYRPPPDEQRAERVALRVGENLFNFMQSFCGADGGKLVVPTDILDRWFRKFQERAKKDPSYLKSFDF
ncbi:hypothetical protein PR202_gb19159 [Eleusine coracana subsp. coracana]|uniref:Hikeshi-like C-terminal domain-containing protein n=1 Tax=Eleusine coracana subsp. coracana TaxID=191504 RepID=A0AAV5F7J9_ELECO|nr:hypothetical protein PR202_gb19159 [Eleusine coracana subsp. coracana]